MRSLLLLLLLSGLSAVDAFAEQRAAWMTDVSQPNWWSTVTVDAGDATPLVLPPGRPTPPKAAINGCFHRAEMRAFMGYPLLNHRNVVRLLGKPTMSEARGKDWIIEWRRPIIVEVNASADPAQSLTTRTFGISVLIQPGGLGFTWSCMDLAKPLAPGEFIL